MARSRSGPLSGRPKTFWNACLYSLDSGELAYRGIERGLAHFKGVNDRKARLLLERLGPAIPKLCLVVEGVQDGGGVPLADSAVDADRNRTIVGEGTRRIVTSRAGHGVVGGQAAIEKQFLTEGDLLRCLWIVLRYDLLCQLDREANLAKGPGLGQGTFLGNRRRLSSRLLASAPATDH